MPPEVRCSVRVVAELSSIVAPVYSTPSTNNFISSFFNVLFAKYLSVPFIVTVAVLFLISVVPLTFSHNGSTTSTISPLPLASPPGISIPEVIVFAIFLFPDVSTILSAGIATVITPL